MSLRVSRILHAGYVFEFGGIQIAFDPLFENPFSGNAHAFPDVNFDHPKIRQLKLAAVFISHFHDDHCSLESLDLLDRATPIYLYCVFEELFTLIRSLGFENVYSLDLNIPVEIGSFSVIPRQALDADVDSMFHVHVAGLHILNVVDAWIDPSTLRRLERLAPWDMVLWPFQTMREIEVLSPSRATRAAGVLPTEWGEVLRALNPRYLVPSSCQFIQEKWSWHRHAFFPISYRSFEEQIRSILPQAQVLRMNPSVTVELDKDSCKMGAPLPWVLPLGPQDVDYDYDGDFRAPPTSVIAQNFQALTADRAERVRAYCRSGLLEKYRSLETVSPYFERPRVWSLALYDHTGQVEDFRYRIKGRSIERISFATGALSWSTEVPISRFYGALEEGESLTSMYVRINDDVFDATTEEELRTVDVLEDPLLRCLFGDSSCAYQRAQLRRLRQP